MGAVLDRADLRTVDYKQRGAEIKRRRLLLGIDSHHSFADATGVTRGAIKNAEAGEPSTQIRTFERLEAFLDARELEFQSEREAASAQVERPGPSTPVTIEMSGVYGIEHITFSGPPEKADEVRRQAVLFMRDMRERADDDD